MPRRIYYEYQRVKVCSFLLPVLQIDFFFSEDRVDLRAGCVCASEVCRRICFTEFPFDEKVIMTFTCIEC